MEKKCKIVLLSDNKGNSLISYKYIGDKELQFGKYKNLSSYYNPQHLYILSYDEIKEGDWVYDKYINKVFKVLGKRNIDGYLYGNINNEDVDSDLEACFKIIATTNPDLIKEGIASIEDGFIKEYCDNPIGEVNIVYEESDIIEKVPKYDNQGIIWSHWDKVVGKEFKPKLYSNGSIIIKSIEESWRNIKDKYSEYKESIKNQSNNQKEWRQKIKPFDMWIEENYEVPKKKQ